MGRQTKKETEQKINALKKAISYLKNKSSYKENKLTYANLIKCVNSLPESKEFTSPISVATIKQPTTKHFKEINNEIKQFRDENKKKILNKELRKEELLKLENSLEDAYSKIVELLDNEMILKEKLKEKETTIIQLKNDFNLYYNEYVSLKDNENQI